MNPTAQLIEPEVREMIAARQFRELRQSLRDLAPADVADVLEVLEPGDAAVAFRVLGRQMAGDVFAEFEHHAQEQLIEQLGDRRAVQTVEALEPDDRASLLDELPSRVAQRLVASMSRESRQEVQTILGYPPQSVGRLMTPDYVKIRKSWNVGQALAQIRRYGRDAETVHWVYVVNQDGKLIDGVHIRSLILADPETPIESLLDGQVAALDATDDQEEAVRVFHHYDRTALPVVDSFGFLLGIITIDDIADVAAEEATEDIHKMAGVEALDEPYMHAGLMEMFRKRGGVLSVLLVAQSVTIGVMGFFEDLIAPLLLVFVPLIIACGGNTGTQASSLLIRALALKELEPGDWARVIRRELVTGLVLGALLGVLAWVAVLGWNFSPHMQAENPAQIGLAVGTAVLCIVLWAVTLGSMFPLLLERLKLDPATISSPLVATLMDVSGLVIYFTIAWLMLAGDRVSGG